MSQYPVQDEAGLYEGVNYLLSGPSGLGQNFAGFSAYTNAWVTGNFRRPYSQTTLADLYVAPIALSTCSALDERTFQLNFASAQAFPPFSPGNAINSDDTDNGFYNGGWGPIGVVECTTTYVIVRTSGSYADPGPATGGNVYYYNTDPDVYFISTDCNARVTVTGGTDRVFVSAQLNNNITVDVVNTATLTYTVAINRYRAFTNNDPINPDYIFDEPVTISQKVYEIPIGTTGTVVLDEIETIFSTVIDQPPPGYYWYIMEIVFQTPDREDLQVLTAETNLRSLSAQVVKA
jgi:hypothetical protein